MRRQITVFGARALSFACALVLLAATAAAQQPRPEQGRAEASKQTQAGAPGGFSGLAKQWSPAVVAVMSRRQAEEMAVPIIPGSPFEEFFRRFDGDREPPMRTALGSGFVVSREGHIVTNHHVVQNSADIRVRFSDGTTEVAEVVGTDPATDIAVLKVNGRKELVPIQWGSSEAVEPGDWVIAIGNPFGLGGTVTVGVLSGRARDMPTGQLSDLLQTDASINRGNSGGPLFNAHGEVIGVNTAILSPTGGNIGIGFAVPSHTAEPVARQLIETGKVERGYIGVRIQSITPNLANALGLKEPNGALVASVEPGSPAERAGIVAGDVITRVGPEPIEDARELSREIAGSKPGATVELSVTREGKDRTFSVELARAPAPDQQATGSLGREDTDRLGVAVAPIDKSKAPEPGMEGVVVQQVVPGSPAAANGIRAGDIIVSANGKPVAQPSDLAEAWRNSRQGDRPVLLRIYRDGGYAFVAVG